MRWRPAKFATTKGPSESEASNCRWSKRASGNSRLAFLYCCASPLARLLCAPLYWARPNGGRGKEGVGAVQGQHARFGSLRPEYQIRNHLVGPIGMGENISRVCAKIDSAHADECASSRVICIQPAGSAGRRARGATQVRAAPGIDVIFELIRHTPTARCARSACFRPIGGRGSERRPPLPRPSGDRGRRASFAPVRFVSLWRRSTQRTGGHRAGPADCRFGEAINLPAPTIKTGGGDISRRPIGPMERTG